MQAVAAEGCDGGRSGPSGTAEDRLGRYISGSVDSPQSWTLEASMVRKTREQVWRELDTLGEDEVRRRLAANPTEVEEPGLIHEWLTQRERVTAALADTSKEMAARRPGLSNGVRRAVGSIALISVAAVALAFLLARRKR
jgi:hypothetical protein